MTPNDQIENVKHALAKGSTIGYLLWYDCENAYITPSNLHQLFNKHGMRKNSAGEFVDFPQDIKPKNAFQKACRQAMTKTGTTSDDRRSITKLIIDGTSKIVYGVVDLDVHQKDETIDPDFSDRVWLDKSTWQVQFDKGHATSKTVHRIFNKLCGEYTTRDISRMIVKATERMAALPLRKAGVVYFIPVAFEKDLQALQGVVNEIGSCDMRLFALGDPGDSVVDNHQNIAAAAKSHIQSKIEDMKQDIAELKQSLLDGVLKGKSAENSIQLRIHRYNELKEKCQILADALKLKAETLESDLSEVRTLIKNELEAA